MSQFQVNCFVIVAGGICQVVTNKTRKACLRRSNENSFHFCLDYGKSWRLNKYGAVTMVLSTVDFISSHLVQVTKQGFISSMQTFHWSPTKISTQSCSVLLCIHRRSHSGAWSIPGLQQLTSGRSSSNPSANDPERRPVSIHVFHITSVLCSLRWLPVAAIIRFQTQILGYKAKNGAPTYLTTFLCTALT